MRLSFYRTQLEKVIAQRNGYLILGIMSLMVCFNLAILVYMLIDREKIVVTPAVLDQKFWITSNQVSPEYLLEMTSFFAYLRLNVTPDNIVQQGEMLLRYTDPTYYNQLKAKLVSESDQVTRQHITFSFFPVDFKVDSTHFQTIISGDLKSQIGQSMLHDKRVSYLIKYRYQQGRLLVKSFEEIKNA